MGAPIAKCTGTPNRSLNRTVWFLVNSRWPPHTAMGMIGTPASAASRTAPVLRSRTVKDALTPASGNTPRSSSLRNAMTALA